MEAIDGGGDVPFCGVGAAFRRKRLAKVMMDWIWEGEGRGVYVVWHVQNLWLPGN